MVYKLITFKLHFSVKVPFVAPIYHHLPCLRHIKSIYAALYTDKTSID